VKRLSFSLDIPFLDAQIVRQRHPSLGAILHELPTGKRVFQDKKSVDTMQAVPRQEAGNSRRRRPQG
jgi:hypothetical protein